jgi:hypothetical protein
VLDHFLDAPQQPLDALGGIDPLHDQRQSLDDIDEAAGVELAATAKALDSSRHCHARCVLPAKEQDDRDVRCRVADPVALVQVDPNTLCMPQRHSKP